MLSEKSSIGLSIYGHGGMNTVWHGGTATFDPDGPGPAPVSTLPGTFGCGTAGVDLSQLFIAPTYSKQLTDKLSVGLGPIVAIQVFRAKGVSAFAGLTESFNRSGGMSMPGDLSGNGRETSYGAGVNLGILYDFSEKFSVGAGYHSKIYMTEFDDYADLFAEDGNFDIPLPQQLASPLNQQKKSLWLLICKSLVQRNRFTWQ